MNGGSGLRVPLRAPILGAAALLVAVGTVALLPEQRRTGFDPLLPLPWWMLTGLFLITSWAPVPVRRRGRTHPVSFTTVPLVFGLFLATPHGLLLGVALGVAAPGLGAPLPRSTPSWPTSRALVGASITAGAVAVVQAAVALTIFHAMLAEGPGTGLVAAVAAVTAAATAGLVGHGLRNPAVGAGWGRDRRFWTSLAGAGLTSLLVAVPAVAAVLVLDHGEAVLPLAASGSAALLGASAFAALGRRRQALDLLYTLSEALAVAPDPAEVIRTVLVETLELARVGYAEVVLHSTGGGERNAWIARRDRPVAGPLPGDGLTVPAGPGIARARHVHGLTPADRAVLDARGISRAVLVPLMAGDVSGHLLAADRVETGSGADQAFSDEDLRLMATVANHAGVALNNARLIGRLHVEARQDELTGLPNRARFRELLEAACRTDLLRPGSGFAVMLLDFDGFKAINDTLGHAAGDDVLRTLGARFAAVLDNRAQVARLGGDEFAVLAPACPDERDAVVVARQLLTAFDEPVVIGTSRLHLGGSLGVALAPLHATTAGELLRSADVAMYEAKAGAGGIRVFTPELLEGDALVLTLGADLRDALPRSEIDMVVHPVLVLATEELHSVEVLARWRHPVHGEVPPPLLFAAAEQAALVQALSEQILELALAQCRRWLEAGTAVRVAVNVAPRWLSDESLPQIVDAALARHGVPAGLLCLELTERGVIADPRRVTQTLQRLQSIGVHLSVDDFGTGYSSLTYLSQLPIDQVKIDKSFVQGIVDGERDLAIVRSLVDLGRHLGLEVVAEGVASEAVRSVLERIGCPLAQGYLFTPPFAAANLDRFVTAQQVPTPVYEIGSTGGAGPIRP